MIIKGNTTECRKKEFEYLKSMKHRQYVNEQIKIYEFYYDILNKKEKKKLKQFKEEKKKFLIIGKTTKSKKFFQQKI